MSVEYIYNPFENTQSRLSVFASEEHPVIVRNENFEVIVVDPDGYDGTVNEDSRIKIFGHNAAKSEAMKTTVAKVVAAIILGGVLAYAIYSSEVISMAGSALSGLLSGVAVTFNANKAVILSLALIGTIAGVVAVTDSLDRITDIGSRALSTGVRVASDTVTGAYNHVIVPGAKFSLRFGGTVTIQTFNVLMKVGEKIPNIADNTARVLARGVGYTASAVSTVSEGIRQLSVDHPRKVGSAVGISILLTGGTLMLASAPVLIQKISELIEIES